MSSLLTVMQEIADKLRDAFDVIEFADMELNVQVEPRLVINPSPPTIDIYPADPARELELAGFGDFAGAHNFTIRARVGVADEDAGQEFLLALMDEEDELCVANPLLADPTLNGHATTVALLPPTGFSLYPGMDGKAILLGCQWLYIVNIAHS